MEKLSIYSKRVKLDKSPKPNQPQILHVKLLVQRLAHATPYFIGNFHHSNYEFITSMAENNKLVSFSSLVCVLKLIKIRIGLFVHT